MARKLPLLVQGSNKDIVLPSFNKAQQMLAAGVERSARVHQVSTVRGLLSRLVRRIEYFMQGSACAYTRCLPSMALYALFVVSARCGKTSESGFKLELGRQGLRNHLLEGRKQAVKLQ